MKKHWGIGLALCLASAVHFWALTLPLDAQVAGFAGLVTNIATGQPIAGARISAAGQTVLSDAQGRYLLPVPTGMYHVRAEAPGYIGMSHRYRRTQGETSTPLDFEMIPLSPSPEEAESIRRKTMPPPQELPPGSPEDTAIRGYALNTESDVRRYIRVLMPDGTVVVMEMDEYLKGVVPHEVPASWPLETLKAQAVAARSIAATSHRHQDQGADICTTEHCQVWRGTHYDTTDRAVDETHGIVGRYEGKVISAFYFGHCDGHTRNSEDIWGGYVPYCRSVACPCGFTTMWGHGVGMCQEGARVLAEQGLNYVQILQHYYTGIDVPPAPPGRVTSASVSPISGDTQTQFTYQASYTSELGDRPVVAQVLIDGHAYALERIAGGTEHTWSYRLVTQLPVGSHTYRFYFDDGYGHISTIPPSGTASGPLVLAPNDATPTPTPLPTIPPGTRSHTIVQSTVADWGRGTHYRTQVVEEGDGALTLDAQSEEGTFVSQALIPPWDFVAMGVIWYAETPPGARISLEARQRTRESWGQWYAVDPSDHSTGQPDLFAAELFFGMANAAQFRVQMHKSTQGAAPLLKQVRFVFIDSTAGPAARELVSRRPTGSPTVISRAAWGADESLMTWPPEYRPPRAIILHTTGIQTTDVDSAAMVRALYEYQARHLGWGDLVFNYIIDPQGTIYEGRSGGVGVVGAHAKEYDWGSIGIALLGDYVVQNVPPAVLSSLTSFLAWQCTDHWIPPTEERHFIEATLPTIMGHRDCQPTECPGSRLYALLPTIRAETMAKMVATSPTIELTSPDDGATVRAVSHIAVTASAALTRSSLYVDDVLRQTLHLDAEPTISFLHHWNTRLETDGPHTLKVVASNAMGQSTAERQVRVDNIAPEGSVSVPTWSRSYWVPFEISSSDAVAVQFSNAWIWEAEDLPRTATMGEVVSDSLALNGRAWHGRAGLDTPGGLFGPYACDLPAYESYTVCFRLRTSDITNPEGIVTVDVVDNQGKRNYGLCELSGQEWSSEGYEEFLVDLAYEDRWPTCESLDVDDGLEFRIWFSGKQDLYVDRVTVFSRPYPTSDTRIHWHVRETEGAQQVTVRFLDAAGNAKDCVVMVRVDTNAPKWFAYGFRQLQVKDVTSGLNAASAAWSVSHDGGSTWSTWTSLPMTATQGITRAILIEAPKVPGTHIRFRIGDLAGNMSESMPLSLSEPPTPTPPSTPPPIETVPAARTPTPDDSARHLTMPLIYK